MSTASYKRNPSQLHLFHCEWEINGEKETYIFRYTGDVFDAIKACYDTVVGAKHPTFRIVNLISREA